MKNYNNVTWREETLEVRPNSSMEKYFMDSIKPNVFVFSGCNTTLYLSTQKTPSPKDYEFQINQNDSQVFGKPIPINTMYIVNPSTATATVKLYYACMDFDPLFLKSFKPQNIDVSAKFEGSLPAGNNKIGNVGISGAIPSGTNKIGNVGITGALPSGTNKIGNVGITGALPAGENTIGKVKIDGAINASFVDVNNYPRRIRKETFSAGTIHTVYGGSTTNDTLSKWDGSSVSGEWVKESVECAYIYDAGYCDVNVYSPSNSGTPFSILDTYEKIDFGGFVDGVWTPCVMKVEYNSTKVTGDSSMDHVDLKIVEVFIPAS